MSRMRRPKEARLRPTAKGFEVIVPPEHREKFLLWWSNVADSSYASSPSGSSFGKIHDAPARYRIPATELAKVCRLDGGTVIIENDVMSKVDNITKCMILLYVSALSGMRAVKSADLLKMLVSAGGNEPKRLDHQLLKQAASFGTEGAKRGVRYGLSEAGLHALEKVLIEHGIGQPKIASIAGVTRK
jgi:hypothetical protein